LHRIRQPSIGKQIIIGTFWSVVGNGFGKVFTFIAMIFVARILGKESFGEIGLVRSTAITFASISGLGIGMTTTKYIAELLHTNKERTGQIIGMTYIFTFFVSLITAITFYLISPYLCEILGKPELTHVMRLGSLLLFLMMFLVSQIAVMTGFQDFRNLAIISVIVGILSLPIHVGCTYWFGESGAVAAMISCVVLNIVISNLFIYKNLNKYKIRYKFSNCYSELSVLLNSNLPIMLGCTLYIGTQLLLQMILRLQPNGAEKLGEFYAAQNIQIAFFVIPALLSTVFFPTLCEIGGTNQGKYWQTVKKGLGLQAIVALIMMLPMILFPKFLMKLNGNEFSNNSLILSFFAIWSFINVLCTAVWQVMIDQKKSWICIVITICEIIIILILAYFLLSNYWNGIGILIALTAGRIFNFIAIICYLQKYSTAQNLKREQQLKLSML
jgi:O-antigen/teichoic acid export membrane protein